MQAKKIEINYTEYADVLEMSDSDAALLTKARQVAEQAYAPYSHFFVGAAALLTNGEIVTGTNQENASYPVGICAERVLMSAASSVYPNIGIKTMAISYHNYNGGESNTPASPCGMCRQSLVEFENRFNTPMRIILSGLKGKVLVLEGCQQLLPLSFSGDDLLAR